MDRILRVMAVVVVLCGTFLLGGDAQAQGKEQLVFSGEGEGTTEIEFWIWCALDESGNYDDCNGAMRFDDLGLVKHVEGEASEPEEGMYVMDVFSTKDDSVACTLVNTPPVLHGPRNTVDITCSAPDASATSTDAVVIATG
jgi:hypothetical protein